MPSLDLESAILDRPDPTTPASRRAAARYVAAKAHDADDARTLLAALGLLDAT